MGHTAAVTLEETDGKFYDALYIEYLQSVMKRVADAAEKKAPEIRVTRSSEQYAQLLPPGILYVSAALMERAVNEAELAGLFAHEIVHRNGFATVPKGMTIPAMTPACAIASQGSVRARGTSREAEIEANTIAIATLKHAGYDPLEMLSLLSKLAYEHPAWSRTIEPDDLLELRVSLESESGPPGGFVIDRSEFKAQRQRFAALCHPAKIENASRPSLHSPQNQPVR